MSEQYRYLDSFPTHPAYEWPKCDFCNTTLSKDHTNSQPYVFAAKCPNGCMSISFRSCRYAHRDCAWQGLHRLRIRGVDYERKRPEEFNPNPWKNKSRPVKLNARELRHRKFLRTRRRRLRRERQHTG